MTSKIQNNSEINNCTKHIFITGGVVSSLGKGITAASIALLMKSRGYKVKIQKLDPYLNVDPGTMSPYQHGEVYVTDDKAETDLDLGHYERFTGLACSQGSNYTSGKIYSNVIERERRGDYLGATVQVIPHITNEIKAAISNFDSSDTDIVITEIGGTAGDIESLPFLEAIRQYRLDISQENAIFIHLTLVPYITAAGELKTKPSQQSVAILRGIGIIPDILICRCEISLQEEHYAKLSLFCNVPTKYVIEEKDVKHSIYEVPVELADQELDKKILQKLNLPFRKLDLTEWKNMLKKAISPSKGSVEIAVVGKYITIRDAYKSIYEALFHGGIAADTKVNIRLVESENIEEKDAESLLKGVSGILIPGGFGNRGIEGKIAAIRYARENKIPFLGICLGMHCAVIEFSRNVCKLSKAHSTEFCEETPNPVIALMSKQKTIVNKGGTMRLGAYPCSLVEGTTIKSLYGKKDISERHRHRYEFNNSYCDIMKENGLVFSGILKKGDLVEIIEYPSHPFFVACQFHPEFKSTPLAAHPLFKGLINAAIKYNNN